MWCWPLGSVLEMSVSGDRSTWTLYVLKSYCQQHGLKNAERDLPRFETLTFLAVVLRSEVRSTIMAANFQDLCAMAKCGQAMGSMGEVVKEKPAVKCGQAMGSRGGGGVVKDKPLAKCGQAMGSRGKLLKISQLPNVAKPWVAGGKLLKISQLSNVAKPWVAGGKLLKTSHLLNVAKPWVAGGKLLKISQLLNVAKPWVAGRKSLKISQLLNVAITIVLVAGSPLAKAKSREEWTQSQHY